MTVIAAFDSFKGSLTSAEAAEAARQGILAACPTAHVVCLPLADGGEGTTHALTRHGDWTTIACQAHDPLMRPIAATYALSANGHTAIVESATAAGLTLIAPDERHPTLTTTYGLGEMLLHAIRHHCRRIVVALGGSATCDAGTGMLAALGVRFLDDAGRPFVPTGATLTSIRHIDWSHLPSLASLHIIAAADVSNPLYGPTGAAHVFAPQKGATADDVQLLDRGLRHFAALQSLTQCRLALAPSMGAAGGLAYALSLIGATHRSGADLALDAAHFDRLLADARLVLTGEGSTDLQTLRGKLPYAVMMRARSRGVPVIALSGRVSHRQQLLAAGFADALSIHPAPLPLEEAMRPDVASRNLANTCKTLMARLG